MEARNNANYRCNRRREIKGLDKSDTHAILLDMGITAKEQVAYMAGIIDGEGSIQIRRHRDKRWEKKGIAYYTSWVVVTVTNTNPKLIRYCTKHFGGYHYTQRDKHDKFNPKHDWHLCGKKAYPFLLSIKKHILLKKLQLEVALQFSTTHTDKEREKLYLRMQKLNKRGKHYEHPFTVSKRATEKVLVRRLQTFIPSR